MGAVAAQDVPGPDLFGDRAKPPGPHLRLSRKAGGRPAGTHDASLLPTTRPFWRNGNTMKHLTALLLALGTATLVACESSDEVHSQVEETSTVSLAITGMT